MVVKNSPAPHHVASHSHSFRYIMLLGLLLGLAVAFVYWSLPKVKISPGGAGIARVNVKGFQSHVVRARYLMSTGTVSLRVAGFNLMPQSTLNPNARGRVAVTVMGPRWLRWITRDTKTVTVAVAAPPLPKVSEKLIHRLLNHGLTVSFAHPVVRVQYEGADGIWHTVSLASPRRSVTLSLMPASPGASGTVSLRAQSRRWEPYAPPVAVGWESVPYVTAQETQATISPRGSLVVRFSQPLRHPRLNRWTLAPSAAGSWREINARQYAFTPSATDGFGPGALVQVTIPGGEIGPLAKSGSMLATPAVLQWVTPSGSVLRLQQLLAVEGYLPVSWTPSGSVVAPSLSSEDATIYDPPSGNFVWKYPNLPAALEALWAPGQMTAITKGAIMQFEAVNKLPVDGIAGPEVWQALIQDRIAGTMNPNPYTYISVTETLPETLELWVGNTLTLTTKANTGIPVTPTFLGTFPVYERLPFQIMRGKNPDGTRYADPVYWIDYFKSSDAVHGFVRASYGFPQSLGCVEVPPSVAETIYNTVYYGTLVTVNPVGIPPAPAH